MAGGADLARFVHTADLHLDRPFRGLHGLNPRVTTVLLDATFDTYQNIIDLTIQQRADALLIAGDIYDGAERSLRAQLSFIDGLEQLDQTGIRSFVCHGLHDRLDDWTARLRFPALAQRFGPGIEAVPLAPGSQVEVIGVSQPHNLSNAELIREFDEARNTAFSVGLLHADITDTLDALADSSLTYWALGNLHQPAVYRDQRPTIVYPGSPQGHQPDETGPRGAYVVDIDRRGRITCQFHALDSIRWVEIRVSTTTIESQAKLLETIGQRIDQAIEAAGNTPIIYRVICYGRGPLTNALTAPHRIADIVAHLNDDHGDREVFAWCHRISCEEPASTERSELRRASGTLTRLLDSSDKLQHDPEARRRLMSELAPLIDDKRFRPYRSDAGLSNTDLVDIICEAEARIVAALGLPE